MRRYAIVLSLVATALLHQSTSFARNYFSLNGKKFIRGDEESRGLEFYPVKLNKGKEREGIPFENMRLKLLSEKPLVSIDSFELSPSKEKQLALNILIEEREGAAIQKMGRKYAGGLIGIFYQGRPLAVVKGNGKSQEGSFVFNYPDEAKFERLISSFAEQIKS